MLSLWPQVGPGELQYLTRILYRGRVSGSPFAEHEVDYILFLQKDVTLLPNSEEVKHVEYISRDHIVEYLAYLEQQRVPVTPWFSLIADHFLLHWWDNLHRLREMQDRDTIHRLNWTLGSWCRIVRIRAETLIDTLYNTIRPQGP